MLPYTIGHYLAGNKFHPVADDDTECRNAEHEAATLTKKLLDVNGTKPVDVFHRQLGKVMWERCGMARTAEGLKSALAEIPRIREEFWREVRVLGSGTELNQELEKAGRVADFLEFGEVMCLDALERDESCGGHFREEHETADGEAKRDDEHFAHAAAWEYTGPGSPPRRHVEPLVFEYVKLATRSYK